MTTTAAAVRRTGVNPVARLGAAFAIAIALVLTIDVVSAATALVLEAALLPLARISARRFWRRTAPLWIAAPLVGLTILLYGDSSGRVYVAAALVRITEGSVQLAVAATLRVLAIGLPAIVLFADVDPTELADGLAQTLRLPSRFVLGALAGVRLVGLFADDWRALSLARRARGVADRGRIARFATQAFALLVLAIRRGAKLATAMEARGFGAPVRRTWARPAAFGAREVVLLGIGVAVAVVAVLVAVLTGSWRFAIHA